MKNCRNIPEEAIKVSEFRHENLHVVLLHCRHSTVGVLRVPTHHLGPREAKPVRRRLCLYRNRTLAGLLQSDWMEDSVMEPIASCGGGILTRKLAKATASRLKVNRVRQQSCPTPTLHRELLFPATTAHPPTWSNILVPVDLTEFSRRTLKWAADLAERLRAKITLLYAPGFIAEAPIPKTAQQSLFHAKVSKAIELQLAEWTNLGAREASENVRNHHGSLNSVVEVRE
jgi:hypothetical protein